MTNETAPEQEDDYWIVSMEVFAFYSAEEAKEYTDRLADAFTAMPESEEYAASVKYYHASDDALEAAQARIAELVDALHDAITRPKGVVPASAEKFYSAAKADAAEDRRAALEGKGCS